MTVRGGYLGGAAQVVVVDLLDGLEVDDPLQLGLVFVCGDKATCWGQKRPLKSWQTFMWDGERRAQHFCWRLRGSGSWLRVVSSFSAEVQREPVGNSQPFCLQAQTLQLPT